MSFWLGGEFVVTNLDFPLDTWGVVRLDKEQRAREPCKRIRAERLGEHFILFFEVGEEVFDQWCETEEELADLISTFDVVWEKEQ